jgi:condensin complex subunit 1
MYAAFVRTVVTSPLPEASWYSAVEAAIASIYALHPTPEHISAAIIRRLAEEAFRSPQGNADHDERECCDEAETGGSLLGEHDNARGQKSTCDGPLSVRALSRFFFVLGHVALQHLVLIERAAKEVRRARFNAEKRAAEGQAERATAAATSGGKQEGDKAKGKGKAGSKQSTTADSEDQTKEGEEDINAELGVGSVAADAELDAMKEAAEAQMFSAQSLLGPYVKIVSAVCHNRQVLSGDSALRSSALLALTKLMVVDGSMCDANLQLVFTLLHNRAVEPALRSNLVIALGDLTLRFPNAMEPWTEHIYRPLGDPDAGVRKNALMVLTHLILNDMMKVKGHIAKVAVCLEDSEPRIAALAQLFFHELAKKEYKGTSPIYNLLPDILSNLSRETSLSRAQFQSVMQQLLSYIKKDRQGDALVEKLCGRFAATQDATQWRNVAFCLTQLPLSDKGMRKLNECFKLYKTALADAEVADLIASILAKAKKNATKPDAKQLVEELEAKIAACAAERAEEEATAERAQQDLASRAESGSAQSQGRHGGDGASDAEGHGGEGVAETAAEEDVEMGDAATDKGRAGGAPLVKPEQEESAIGPISDCNTTIPIPMEQATRSPDAPAASRNRSRRSRQQSKDAEAVPVSQEEAATSKAPGVRRSSRRGTSGVSGSIQVPVVKEESEERVTRARRSTRGKQSMSDAFVVGVKARKGRRRAGAVVDSDGGSEEEEGDEELKIAALQAGMAAIKIEQEM